MARSAGDPRIPDKQYFRIGEVAEIADVEAYVLRFWESEFGSLAPSKSRSNQRRYSRKDVELVLRIRDLLYEEGYTIAGARRQLRRRKGLDSPEVPARTRAVLARARKDVEELLQLVED
jgi:DNA-binding transcriptional MerR regulator